MLKGKRFSILGDSISTYKGVSDDGTANSSIRYNFFRYKEPFPVEKTYWGRLIDSLGLELCVNNSYSGGNLSGADNPDSGLNRAKNLSRDDGSAPDIIILFMGINDLGRGVDAEVFGRDYAKTLDTLTEKYARAKICCVNLPDRDIYLKTRAEAFNGQIEKAVRERGERVFTADLFSSRLNNDFYYMNTTDGLHPDEDGMKYIAEIIEEALIRNLSDN